MCGVSPSSASLRPDSAASWDRNRGLGDRELRPQEGRPGSPASAGLQKRIHVGLNPVAGFVSPSWPVPSTPTRATPGSMPPAPETSLPHARVEALVHERVADGLRPGSRVSSVTDRVRAGSVPEVTQIASGMRRPGRRGPLHRGHIHAVASSEASASPRGCHVALSMLRLGLIALGRGPIRRGPGQGRARR
jgi:hypothetical protein